MPTKEKSYRNRLSGKGFRVKVEQTDLWISAPQELKPLATKAVVELRHQLERYLTRHREFAKSLTPLEPLTGAPEIVRRMCKATQRAQVGPMAAVAGTIAQLVGERLGKKVPEGAVENGGDLFLWGEGLRKVGIFSGDHPLHHLAIEVEVKSQLGICTSSGRIGHSLSLGKANAVTVVSKDSSLADAWATALANMVKGEESIPEVLKIVQNTHEILAAVVIFEGKMGVWGDLRIINW